MAVEINLQKGDMVKKGFLGFSWTTFFFGFFLPLFRGDWLWLVIMIILGVVSCGIANIILAFLYNKFYTSKLLENGWEPADDFSRNMLISKGILRR